MTAWCISQLPHENIKPYSTTYTLLKCDVFCQNLTLLGRVWKLSLILIHNLQIFSFLTMLQFLKTDVSNQSYIIFLKALPGKQNWEIGLSCYQCMKVSLSNFQYVFYGKGLASFYNSFEQWIIDVYTKFKPCQFRWYQICIEWGTFVYFMEW